MTESKAVGRLNKLFEPHEQKLDILNEALEEVSKEKAEERKGKAKELIRKALDLQNQMQAAQREFQGKSKKWEKELGKVMNRLENMAQGKPLDDGEDEEGGGDGDASEE
jgi:hypothetical protein